MVRAAAKDIKLSPEAARASVDTGDSGQHLALIQNLNDLAPHALDLSVARAPCTRLRSSSARETSQA